MEVPDPRQVYSIPTYVIAYLILIDRQTDERTDNLLWHTAATALWVALHGNKNKRKQSILQILTRVTYWNHSHK